MPSQRRLRRGFTLVEALVGLTVLGFAAGSLLLGVQSALDSAHTSWQQCVAQGMAEQFVDEFLGKRYAAPGVGPYQTNLGPSAIERSMSGRAHYDDLDDCHNFSASPPRSPRGTALGSDADAWGPRHPNFAATAGLISRWRQQVEVYYVSATNLAQRLPSGQTSDYRAVDVRIWDDEPTSGPRELARVRRVVAYVPEPD